MAPTSLKNMNNSVYLIIVPIGIYASYVLLKSVMESMLFLILAMI